MFGIKQLDKYIFLRFIEVLFATFFICTFIFLMQFLWKHIDDLVGKGLEISILIEFFYYAFLSIVPLALPLAILLASLMAFGNLGEKMELLALKAAGISLFRIMLSLLIFISFISIGAFFFSNDVLPDSQKKLWALIFSLRQTSPELDIPKGEFYSGITGYNIYVREKDPNRKLLKNLMIYDFSKGFNNASVTVADSARIKLSPDKTFLLFTLYSGESFENLRREQSQNTKGSIPYRRESFSSKEVIIDFNTNFMRLNANLLKNEYMSKNMHELNLSIDSLQLNLDSITTEYSKHFVQKHFFDRQILESRSFLPSYKKNNSVNADSLFFRLKQKDMEKAMVYSLKQAHEYALDVEYTKTYFETESDQLIRHLMEWHRKFTLPFACIIFFFIGAPLGAIIRKGGLGMPVVISVLMFLFYYIIDFSGYKLARDDVWTVWEGIWLSSFCLLPIGIFLTYKAAMDSPIFNSETYRTMFGKIIGTNSMSDERLKTLDEKQLIDIVKNYRQYGYDEKFRESAVLLLEERGITKKQLEISGNLENKTFDNAYSLYNTYNKNAKKAFIYFIITLVTALISSFFSANANYVIGLIFLITKILFVILYFISVIKSDINRYHFFKEIKEERNSYDILLFYCIGIEFYILMYFYLRNEMKEKMKNIK